LIATDAMVTGLKMWETNFTWTVQLQSEFDGLHIETGICCGPVRPNSKMTDKGIG